MGEISAALVEVENIIKHTSRPSPNCHLFFWWLFFLTYSKVISDAKGADFIHV
jgi:hypothetical protein